MKTQVEITSRNSVIKKEIQNFKYQQKVLIIGTDDLVIKILNEIITCVNLHSIICRLIRFQIKNSISEKNRMGAS